MGRRCIISLRPRAHARVCVCAAHRLFEQVRVPKAVSCLVEFFLRGPCWLSVSALCLWPLGPFSSCAAVTEQTDSRFVSLYDSCGPCDPIPHPYIIDAQVFKK